MMMMTIIKFLVLVLVVVISPKSINADRELMIKECHNARVPAICMRCLESDPSSVHADRFGIANIVIHCLQSHLYIITNNINDLSSQTKDSGVKATLDSCKRALTTNTTTELSQAKSSLKSRNYDKAGQSISIALAYPMLCELTLFNLKYEAFQLFTKINLYGELCNAAMRIIDRFPSM